MGDGARRAQMENRFGLGQPVDTYGIPCIHVKPISPGTKATAPKATFDWSLIFKDDSVAKKVSSESWVRSFVKEIMDYGKLVQIGEGETEILGLKIEMEIGIVQRGDPNSVDKSYFELNLVDTGSKIRVYEDNTVTVWDGKGFRRLKIEQLGSVNIEPLEIITGGGTRSGTDLTTILMRDYLEKIGFFDQFVIGQETDKVFGVKGTVKDNGLASDGRYVTIEYKADTRRGSGVKEVRITADGATVNGRAIVGVETGEDGAVKLLYKHGDEVWGTPINLPTISVKPSPASKVELVAGKVDLGRTLEDPTFKAKFEAIKGEIGIQNTKDFTDTGAYAMYGKTAEDFKRTYGKENWKNLRDYANELSNSIIKEELEKHGLKGIESEIHKGAEPHHERGPDIIAYTMDRTELKVDIEFAGSGKKNLNNQVYKLLGKFDNREADVGIIFWEGEYHIFVNPDTGYMPLRDIALKAAQRGNRSIRDFPGIAAITGLGLLTGNFTDMNGKAMSVTDDTGKWIGKFQDSYLDHAAINGSTVLGSKLTLTSIEGSYQQNVRSSGSTIIGSAISDSNVSAKLIYGSNMQNALAALLDHNQQRHRFIQDTELHAGAPFGVAGQAEASRQLGYLQEWSDL